MLYAMAVDRAQLAVKIGLLALQCAPTNLGPQIISEPRLDALVYQVRYNVIVLAAEDRDLVLVCSLLL